MHPNLHVANLLLQQDFYSKLGMSVYIITLHEGLPFMFCFVLCLMLRISHVIAELKGEASNRDTLSFRVGMYVRMYVCISTACAMQFYACVCISVMLAQYNPMLPYVHPSCLQNYCTIQWPKCATGDDYDPGLLPGLCGPYLMEEHNHKRLSLPCSLRIAYDFSNALKIHLNVCQVCCPLNDQI